MSKLLEDCKTICPNVKTRIGRTNFLKVTTLLRSKGIINTGLLSYCVKLRDAGRVLDRMMKIISELATLQVLVSKKVTTQLKMMQNN